MSMRSDDSAIWMPMRTMAQMELLGQHLGASLGLDFSTGPSRIDWPDVVDRVLPRIGIHVYPVHPAEIDGDEGATDPKGGPEINVLLAEHVYAALRDPSPRGNRARATVAHEISHAVLHVPVIRRQLHNTSGELLLRRVRQDRLPKEHDPEWQAWALAGCLVAPRDAIVGYESRGVERLARDFGVSPAFLNAHLGRLCLKVGSVHGAGRLKAP